jgi:hypothetical protein
VYGFDGEMFGRPMRSKTIDVFIGDIFRAVKLNHTTSLTDWYDVKLKRYEVKYSEILNATSAPGNADYYSYSPNGLWNLSLPTAATTFISFPHFLFGDDVLVDSVEGT